MNSPVRGRVCGDGSFGYPGPAESINPPKVSGQPLIRRAV